MKYFVFSILSVLLFIGCASRQYYEPKDRGFIAPNKIVQTNSYIKSYNSNGATLENHEVITNKGILKTKLPEGYTFLNLNENIIMASDNQKNILLIGERNETIELKKNVIGASKENDILALVFADNTIALYNLKTKQYIFRTYNQHSFVNDTRVAAPLILNKIILFPTLDGKVVIVEKQTYKTVRTINIDPDKQINNIILLKTIGSTLIAATQNKIISIQSNQQKTKEFFIQNYFVDEGHIYIAKLDGTIVKLDSQLNEINSKKFRFAKILSLSTDYENNLYALELGGYLIKLNPDFTKTNVFRFEVQDDEKMFALKNKIYFDNKILYLGKENAITDKK